MSNAPERIWAIFDCDPPDQYGRWDVNRWGPDSRETEYVRADLAGHTAQDKLLSANENTASEGQTQAAAALVVKLRTLAERADQIFDLDFASPWREAADMIEGLVATPPERPAPELSMSMQVRPDSYFDAWLTTCTDPALKAEVERLRAEVARLRQSVADDELRAVEWDEELTAAQTALSTAREDALKEAAALFTEPDEVWAAHDIRTLMAPQRPHSEAGAAIPPAQVHRDTSEDDNGLAAAQAFLGDPRIGVYFGTETPDTPAHAHDFAMDIGHGWMKCTGCNYAHHSGRGRTFPVTVKATGPYAALETVSWPHHAEARCLAKMPAVTPAKFADGSVIMDEHKAEMTSAEYQRLTGPYAALEGDA